MTTVAIIGAGIAGLTAGYKLAAEGFEVTVYERDSEPGGLASAFHRGAADIERYYHFICPPDQACLALLDELDLSEQLVWRTATMGVFHHGTYHRFGTAGSLMRFAPLSFGDRLRFGLAALEARARTDWSDLDGLSARDWLILKQGRAGYEAIWRPLLELKFGEAAGDISAAWMWARINRIAHSRDGILGPDLYGYLEGGTAVLIRELVHRIERHGGRVRLSSPVMSVNRTGNRVSGVTTAEGEERFDIVVSTVATPVFLSMTPDLPADYQALLAGIAYHGIACWTLIARQPLCGDFWLNVNDARIPLPGVITFTHLNPTPALEGLHLHYVPFYMPLTDPRWTVDEREWLPELLAAMDLIRPGFSDGLVEAHLFRDAHAQPIFDVGFAARNALALRPETPFSGLYRLDMSQVYPADRSIVNAIANAQALASALSAVG